MLTEVRKDEVVISQEEYTRLNKLVDLLWEVEAALPCGLESWIGDDELEELRH